MLLQTLTGTVAARTSETLLVASAIAATFRVAPAWVASWIT